VIKKVKITKKYLKTLNDNQPTSRIRCSVL